MDKRTLTALQGSIEKWKAIEEGRGYDGYADNCPLCQEFINEVDDNDQECEGCPVAAAGHRGCEGSPWAAWNTAQEDFNRMRQRKESRIADTPALIALARAEREFLESLLPKETPS